jgi:hypothetical protein
MPGQAVHLLLLVKILFLQKCYKETEAQDFQLQSLKNDMCN